METTLAAETVHAAWRLRRCAEAESAIEVQSDTQSSIDRARAQSHPDPGLASGDSLSDDDSPDQRGCPGCRCRLGRPLNPSVLIFHSLFAIREYRMKLMMLKPQDVYVVLKIVAAGSRGPYAQLATELSMSPSEVHASVKRAQSAKLLHGAELQHRPNLAALEEFLVHGLKYAFPADRGEFTRGVPTSYAAEPLRDVIGQGNEPIPVWPCPGGNERGIAFEPLYKTAPGAAMRDPAFYEYLALTDALRGGRARDRKYAEQELHRRFQKANARSEC
jgi:DNA-binding Lrp family transcriptional regulator